MIPLLPGMEGDIEKESGNMLRIVLSKELLTINRGGKSIIERISKYTDTPEKYVTFFGLRTHAIAPKTKAPVTELIYIHSKCLIIDDNYLLLGSANINDRSMVGHRDTELAMVIHDRHKVSGTLDGQKCLYSECSHTFRKKIFTNTFGLSDEEVADFMSDEMWTNIEKRASRNTEIYSEVFGCYPDDKMDTYDNVKVVRENSDITKYDELKDEIKGIAVKIPLDFLCKENLEEQHVFEMKTLVLPTYMFT